MTQAMRKAADFGRADVPRKALVSWNSGDQKERRAIEDNQQGDERDDVGEQQPRPPERAHEWRQQQDERQLQRHRNEANRSAPRSLDNDNRPAAERITCTGPLLARSRSRVSHGPPPPEQRSTTRFVPVASIAERIFGAIAEKILVALAVNESQSVPPSQTPRGHHARPSISTSCRRRTDVRRF